MMLVLSSAQAFRSLIPCWRALMFAAFVVKIGDPDSSETELEEPGHPLPMGQVWASMGEVVAIRRAEIGLRPV